MPSIYRTLLVGLGAHGRNIIEDTWLSLIKRSDSDKPFPYVNALVIDIGSESSEDRAMNTILPADSYLELRPFGMQAYLQSLDEEHFPELADIPEGAEIGCYGTGNEQDIASTRLGMHLMFTRDRLQIASALELHLSRLLQDDEWTWAKDSSYQPGLDNTVMIYILAALDEEDSGGILPGFLELLPELPFFQEGGRRYISTGVFTCFEALKTDLAAANTYATLVELNGLFNEQLERKTDERFDPRRLGTNYACYIVEAVDEKGMAIESTIDGDALVVQFIVNMVSRPIPLTLMGEGILIQYETMLKRRTALPELPLFSSFTQVEYTVSLELIEKYLAARIGEQIVSAEGLARNADDNSLNEVAKLLKEDFLAKNRLSLKELIGDPEDKLLDSLVTLDAHDQQQALIVFQPEQAVADRQALSRAFERIQVREEERQHRWLEYQAKLPIRMAERVAGGISYKIKHYVATLVNDRDREDGLSRGQVFLSLLKERTNEWLGSLEPILKQREEQAETARRRAEEAGKQARAATQNRPRIMLLLGRLLFTWLLGLLVWCGACLAAFPDQTADFWINTAVKLVHGLTFLTLPLGLYYLSFIGLLGLRFVLDWIIGRNRVRKLGHNVPGWDQLAWILLWPALSFGTVAALAYRHMLRGNIVYLNLFPADTPNLVLVSAGISGLLSILSYAWWFIADVARIRRKVIEWLDALQVAVNWQAYISRIQQTEWLYQNLLSQIEAEITRLAGFRKGLVDLHVALQQKQGEVLDALDKSEHRFCKLAVADKTSLDQIYSQQLESNPDLRCSAFLKTIPDHLDQWLDQQPEEKIDLIEDFIADKLKSLWQGRNLVTILAPGVSGNAVLLRNELQPKLSFIRNFAPQWSRYAQFGELQIYAGVGDEENKALTGALRGLGQVSFQAPPAVYETGEPFLLTITMVRHACALAELEEIIDYRGKYNSYPAWAVHTRKSRLLDPLPEVRLRQRTSQQPVIEPTESQPEGPEVSAPPDPVEEARVLLGVSRTASVDKMRARHHESLEKLEEARRGLLDKFNRYRHFAAIERGEAPTPNWFEILGLDTNRQITRDEVLSAFAHKKQQLDEARDLLIERSSVAEIGEQNQEKA